jgi:hypothetical protein
MLKHYIAWQIAETAGHDRLLLADFCLSREAENDPKLPVATDKKRPKAGVHWCPLFFAKIGDGFEIRHHANSQPHQLDVALGFSLHSTV